MRAWQLNLCLGYFVVHTCTMPAFAIAELDLLNSESIASSALQVAQNTNTTGYCYAAICKALRPLNVNLSGAAAYQAKDLLLQDQRFLPADISSVDYLRRGDIVVYNKSSSHPYGHIAVYQGNDTEASDHIAPITSSQAYGGATVFRLRDDWSINDIPIAVAPDFTNQNPYPYIPMGRGSSAPASSPSLAYLPPNLPSPASAGGNQSTLSRQSKALVTRTANKLLRRCLNTLFN